MGHNLSMILDWFLSTYGACQILKCIWSILKKFVHQEVKLNHAEAWILSLTYAKVLDCYVVDAFCAFRCRGASIVFMLAQDIIIYVLGSGEYTELACKVANCVS